MLRLEHHVEYGDVEKAFKVSKSVSLRYILNSLSDKEKTLLRFITRMDKKNITSGQLYEEYNRENKIGYATYNRQINKLEFLRLIDTTYTGSGKKGNSRYINLRFDSKQIQENLPQQKRRSL